MELSDEQILKKQGYIMTYKCLINKLGTVEAVFLSELISKYKYFESKGMLFVLEPVDSTAPGWNNIVTMKWGLDNSLGTAIDWSRLFGEDLFIQTNMVRFESWYNLGLTADALGLSDEAIRAYQGFIERAPSSMHQQITYARERIEVLNLHRPR